MTTAAWTMLAITWSVIAFFTVRFFLKVVRTPTDSPREATPHDPPRDERTGQVH